MIAPLLANAYLADFDHRLERRGLAFVRYSDNIAVACREEPEAVAALRFVERELARVGLRLNAAKTAVVLYDAGFTFLGQRFPVYPRRTEDPASIADLVPTFAESVYWRARQQARRLTGRWPA